MNNAPYFACSNPNCRSYGKVHPNCRCLGPGEANPDDHYSSYAGGGEVHFCASRGTHKEGCEYFASGGEVEANQEFEQHPDLAVDHHILQKGLLSTLKKTGHTKSDAEGKIEQDFWDAARHGRRALKSHTDNIINPKVPRLNEDESRTKGLQEHLAELSQNPEKALEIGGDLGNTLPIHHAIVASKAASAMNYLKALKPVSMQAGPLDRLLPPSLVQQKNYQRQAAIAEDPSLVYQHTKDGTLLPQDLKTIDTLYPKLRRKMQDHAFEKISDAQMNNQHLSYSQKRKLSALLGEPLSYTQGFAATQAIMKANAPMQPPAPPTKPPKKATGVELKQINKVNELYETPLQKLQIGSKD